MVKSTDNWAPLQAITRNGNQFSYIGEIGNTKKLRDDMREYLKENGRKSAFVVAKDNKKYLCCYVSVDYYPNLCNVINPAFGTKKLSKKVTIMKSL